MPKYSSGASEATIGEAALAWHCSHRHDVTTAERVGVFGGGGVKAAEELSSTVATNGIHWSWSEVLPVLARISPLPLSSDDLGSIHLYSPTRRSFRLHQAPPRRPQSSKGSRAKPKPSAAAFVVVVVRLLASGQFHCRE